MGRVGIQIVFLSFDFILTSLFMRKKLTSMLLLSALVLGASMNVQSGPPPGEEKPVTICYYGVTLKVSEKIAKRYFKLGATEGACGQEDPCLDCR